jgi:hypothetical protein
MVFCGWVGLWQFVEGKSGQNPVQPLPLIMQCLVEPFVSHTELLAGLMMQNTGNVGPDCEKLRFIGLKIHITVCSTLIVCRYICTHNKLGFALCSIPRTTHPPGKVRILPETKPNSSGLNQEPTRNKVSDFGSWFDTFSEFGMSFLYWFQSI